MQVHFVSWGLKMTESLVIKEQLAESQSEIKTYERLDLSKKPACYSCKCCCNACFCCFKSCFQVPVLCCCRCIVPPKVRFLLSYLVKSISNHYCI